MLDKRWSVELNPGSSSLAPLFIKGELAGKSPFEERSASSDFGDRSVELSNRRLKEDQGVLRLPTTPSFIF